MLVKGISSLMLYPSLGSGNELVIPQRAQNTTMNMMKFIVRGFCKVFGWFLQLCLDEGTDVV